MTYDNFTIKAQEAILKAQQRAGKLEQQGVDTVHLMKGDDRDRCDTDRISTQ